MRKFLIGAAILVTLLIVGCGDKELLVSDTAPGFTLPSADGRQVSMSEYTGKANVLLYFHMAYG